MILDFFLSDLFYEYCYVIFGMTPKKSYGYTENKAMRLPEFA